MQYNFIYYRTDGSFDYLGPFGTETEHVEDLHGFSIDLDSEDNPDFNSLEGFGEFDDVNDLKSLEELKQYILDNMSMIKDSGDEPERFLELVSFIDDYLEETKCA